MERGRAYSGNGWNSPKARTPIIATIKPVSKSLSEDNLNKTIGTPHVAQRIYSRLKIDDLSLLKKDSLIGELEKCLEELETEQDQTVQLSDIYDKVELERNQLLEELETAFQDLQEYMHRQKVCEEKANAIEADRDELLHENECLKAALSTREAIRTNKLSDENRRLKESVKELSNKNDSLVDEINDLYQERQTLISSLLSLRSEQVDEVIRRRSISRSRSASLTSRESAENRSRVDSIGDEMDVDTLFDVGDIENSKRAFEDVLSNYKDLKTAFARVQDERSEFEKEIGQLESEKEVLRGECASKSEELANSLEDRNEKNLLLSRASKDKRDLQRHVDDLRDKNRARDAKNTFLEKQVKELNERISHLLAATDGSLQNSHDKLRKEHKTLQVRLADCQADHEKTAAALKQTNGELQVIEKGLSNRVHSLEIDNTKLRSGKTLLEKMVRRIEAGEKELRIKCKESDEERRELKEKLQEKETLCERLSNDLELINEERVNRDDALNNNPTCFVSQETVDNLNKEIEHLRVENESLRMNSVEVEQNGLAAVEKERQKYASLLLKYDDLCVRHEKESDELNGRLGTLSTRLKETERRGERVKKENEELWEGKKELEGRIDVLVIENSRLTEMGERMEEERMRLTEEIRTLTQSNSALMERRIGMNNEGIESLKIRNMQNNDFVETLTKELCELRSSKEKVVKDCQYILQSRFEESRSQLKVERDAFETKYNNVRVDVDKLKREKEHFIKTVNTLREENAKLHDELRVQPSDVVLQRANEERNRLSEQVEVFQNAVRQLSNENKALFDRIGRTDDSVSITIRSLKARKTELQLRVQSLEHEKEMYSAKLVESEHLLVDVQKALAHANDLAMQKSLEATKIKRNVERRMERLSKENAELRLAMPPKQKMEAARKSSLPPLQTHAEAEVRRHSQHAPSNLSAVECDLDEQLKQLLDLTNDLTAESNDSVFLTSQNVKSAVAL